MLQQFAAVSNTITGDPRTHFDGHSDPVGASGRQKPETSLRPTQCFTAESGLAQIVAMVGRLLFVAEEDFAQLRADPGRGIAHFEPDVEAPHR